MNKMTIVSDATSQSLGDKLYQQLKHGVQTLEPHARLTSERKLARQHGASHSTVRRAMNRLQADGLIYKVHGGGCFVAEPEASGRTLQTVVYVDTEVGSVTHPFFARRLAGVLDTCESCGFRLQIVRYREAQGMEANTALLQELERQEVVGVILPWMKLSILSRLRAANPALQVVTTATRYPPPGVAAVFPDYGAIGQMAARHASDSGATALTILYDQHDSAAGALAFAAAREKNESCLNVTPQCAPLKADAAALADAVAAAGNTVVAADDSQTTRHVMAALQERHPAFAARCRWISHANRGDDDLPPEVVRLETDGYPYGRRLVESLHQLLQHRAEHSLVSLIGPNLRLPHTTRD